jgi:hypothetical protein
MLFAEMPVCHNGFRAQHTQTALLLRKLKSALFAYLLHLFNFFPQNMQKFIFW